MNELNKKFGLFTAICIVTGLIIGSGIFFKAPKVLAQNGGSMTRSLLTVALVGLIMLICAYTFAILARRHSKVNGLVDYAEASVGQFYSYIVGWFTTVIYLPTMTSAIAWVSASYTASLLGLGGMNGAIALLAAAFLCLSFILNALAPTLSGKIQVSTTVIKLIPLALLAVVGTVIGTINGRTAESLITVGRSASGGGGFFGAAVAFAFAYEGWIIATTLNSEIRDSKKNLPKALMIGGLAAVIAYLGYYLGLAGLLTPDQILQAGDGLPRLAYTALFGGNAFFGSAIYVFIIISCLGTMNGCMMGLCRGMYSLARRGQGPAPGLFGRLNERSNMPPASCVAALILTLIWLAQWELGFIRGLLPEFLCFEHDELPIITLYGGYIPIFISMMIKERDLNFIDRFLFPSLATVCSVFMSASAVISYKTETLYYLAVFAVITLIGLLFYRWQGRSNLQRIAALLRGKAWANGGNED